MKIQHFITLAVGLFSFVNPLISQTTASRDTVFFANKSIRKITEYSGTTKVKWCVYRNRQPVAEISSDQGIGSDLCTHLNILENEVLNKELNSVGVLTKTQQGTRSSYDYKVIRADPYEELLALTSILKSRKFTGTALFYNENNTLRKKYTFNEGSVSHIWYTYNNKKTLVKLHEYEGGKLVREVSFNKNGEEKVKTY